MRNTGVAATLNSLWNQQSATELPIDPTGTLRTSSTRPFPIIHDQVHKSSPASDSADCGELHYDRIPSALAGRQLCPRLLYWTANPGRPTDCVYRTTLMSRGHLRRNDPQFLRQQTKGFLHARKLSTGITEGRDILQESKAAS